MTRNCGNCANYRKKTNQFSEECGKCVSATLENGEKTEPSRWRAKPMTNADRIRAMSDEELAEMLADDDRACPPRHHNCRKYIDKCDGCWLEWLRQPAEGE